MVIIFVNCIGMKSDGVTVRREQVNFKRAVHATEMFGRVWPANIEAAQGRDIDDADIVADVQHLIANGLLAHLGLAVVGRAPPETGRHQSGSQFQMAVMHRRAPLGLEDAAGHVPEFLRDEGRALRGDGRGRKIAAHHLRQNAHGGDRRMLALRRPHADGGVALQEFDVVIPVGSAVQEILHLQVLVEIDEVLALSVRKDRPWMRLILSSALDGQFWRRID